MSKVDLTFASQLTQNHATSAVKPLNILYPESITQSKSLHVSGPITCDGCI